MKKIKSLDKARFFVDSGTEKHPLDLDNKGQDHMVPLEASGWRPLRQKQSCTELPQTAGLLLWTSKQWPHLCSSQALPLEKPALEI